MPHTTFKNHDSLLQFTGLNTPIWIFDIDRHCIWWGNQAALDYWGADSVDDLRRRDFSTDSASVRARLKQIVDNAGMNGRLTDTWTLYPKNEPRTTVLAFQKATIENGASAVLVEVDRVIERQATDEDIRIFEAARSSALLISTFSQDGKLLAQNPAALNCYGPTSTFVEPGSTELSNRFESAADASVLLDATKKNVEIDQEFSVITCDGPRVHRICCRRGRDPVSGEFVAVLSEEDVTDANRLQTRLLRMNEDLEAAIALRTSELKESEERYALATQTAAIWDWNIEDNNFFISPSFVEALGYEYDEFMHIIQTNGSGRFVHPDEVTQFQQDLVRHLKEADRPLEFEHRFIARDGQALWFSAQGITLHNEEGIAIRSVGLMTDISKRKSLEASLLSHQRLEAMGQLTGGIAHDFNNLLTVIQGNAQLLEMSETADEELTQSILSAAEKGAELTRHLLAYSRKQTLLPRKIDLGALMDGMRKTILRLLGEDISVQIEVQNGPVQVFADRTHLESALLNLALNARDAMPKGGRLTMMCRNIEASEMTSSVAQSEKPLSKKCVEVCVSDTGNGMCPETMERAFEPFFTTKEVGKGSGLGLSMVLGFSRQSGGDVSIISNQQQGTSVSIFLPRADSGSDIDAAPEAEPKKLFGQGELVHLVEDDPDVRMAMRRILETLNYRVIYSSTVAEAQRKIRNTEHPDIHLVDVVLPGGESGFEFAQSLRAQNPDAKIILMSGYPKTNLPGDLHIEPSLAFLQKPVDSHNLSRALHSTLES